MIPLLLPDHLFGLGGVQLQVVCDAPTCELLDFLFVCRFITPHNQGHYFGVISVLDDVFEG